MKRLLLLLALLFVGIAPIMANEAEAEKKEGNEEKEYLSDEERSVLIKKAIASDKIELVIDPWGGEGAECKELTKSGNGYVSYSDKPEVFFERGYKFTPLAFVDNFRYVFEHEGKFYGANMGDIQLADKDDREEYSFMIRGKSSKMASAAGRFYGTSSALWLMLLVMGGAAAVALLYFVLGLKSLPHCFGCNTGCNFGILAYRDFRLHKVWWRYLLVVRIRPLRLLWLTLASIPLRADGCRADIQHQAI